MIWTFRSGERLDASTILQTTMSSNLRCLHRRTNNYDVIGLALTNSKVCERHNKSFEANSDP